jgi:hypothetical protein
MDDRHLSNITKLQKEKHTGISEVQTRVINKWAKSIKLELHMAIIEMW